MYIIVLKIEQQYNMSIFKTFNKILVISKVILHINGTFIYHCQYDTRAVTIAYNPFSFFYWKKSRKIIFFNLFREKLNTADFSFLIGDFHDF